MKELVTIQQRLKAPKEQFNSFGKYKYRSCEDIVEAAKPIYTELGCYLTLSDDIVVVGDRIYVKATATLTNSDNESVSTSGWAREADTSRSNMDPAQITGSASSYARKYALNGLFAIDDTKDPDATNTHGKDVAKGQTTPPVPAKSELEPEASQESDEFYDIQNAIMCCNSTLELTTLYNQHPEWQPEQKIVAIFTKRKNELNNGNKTKTN